MFEFLVSKNPTPIGIDLDQKSIINVSRSLQGDYTMSQIKSGAKLNKVKPKFGSKKMVLLGNRGVNNRGNLFEDLNLLLLLRNGM